MQLRLRQNAHNIISHPTWGGQMNLISFLTKAQIKKPFAKKFLFPDTHRQSI
jgi:hypothetical protein